MLQRLQTTLKKGLLLSFLALGLPQVGKADSLQVKKDVFLIDVSRSMQGHGSVSTPNVFDDVKRELTTAFGKAKASKAVLIPFSDKVRGGVSVELPQDSSVIRSYIEQLRTSDGRTDIYRAWEVGLDSLHSDASGYRLYLITDALHNSKRYDIDSLRSLLSHWESEQKDAYLVLLNPAFESSELANIFRANERMYVINSLQDLYNDAQVDTTKTVAATSPQQESSVSTKSSEHSLWWLWLLLIALAVGVIIYVAFKFRLLGRGVDVGIDVENEQGSALVSSEGETSGEGDQNVIDKAKRYFETCPSDGDIEDDYDRVPARGSSPGGKKDENKENRSLRELVDDPYRDTETLFDTNINRYHFSEESKRLMKADLEESRGRTTQNSSQNIRRVNGEPDFFSHRFADVVVPSVTAQELVAKGLVSPNMSDDKIDVVTRAQNYMRMEDALDRRWKLPRGTCKKYKIIGALFHCTVHEDKSGYLFLVRTPLHMAISHTGAASAVAKDVREIFAKEKGE